MPAAAASLDLDARVDVLAARQAVGADPVMFGGHCRGALEPMTSGIDLFSPLWHRAWQAVRRGCARSCRSSVTVIRGEIWYSAKDRIGSRVHRFSPGVYAVLMPMNGQRTLRPDLERRRRALRRGTRRRRTRSSTWSASSTATT